MLVCPTLRSFLRLIPTSLCVNLWKPALFESLNRSKESVSIKEGNCSILARYHPFLETIKKLILLASPSCRHFSKISPFPASLAVSFEVLLSSLNPYMLCLACLVNLCTSLKPRQLAFSTRFEPACRSKSLTSCAASPLLYSLSS